MRLLVISTHLIIYTEAYFFVLYDITRVRIAIEFFVNLPSISPLAPSIFGEVTDINRLVKVSLQYTCR